VIVDVDVIGVGDVNVVGDHVQFTLSRLSAPGIRLRPARQ
jgi:hypothetical protein